VSWATARLDALVRGDVLLPPVVQTLLLGTLDEWGPGWARKTWTVRPELMNADGSMFGGYLAALGDQILAFATMTVVPADKIFRTVNLHLDFFKLIRGGDLAIEGRVTAQSASMIAVEADFRLGDGALAARAHAQQILVPPRRGWLKRKRPLRLRPASAIRAPLRRGL
jgi:acyl-coenzyme A thioesterase PaaI-like protein